MGAADLAKREPRASAIMILTELNRGDPVPVR